jgi:hypothetical protein
MPFSTYDSLEVYEDLVAIRTHAHGVIFKDEVEVG